MAPQFFLFIRICFEASTNGTAATSYRKNVRNLSAISSQRFQRCCQHLSYLLGLAVVIQTLQKAEIAG